MKRAIVLVTWFSAACATEPREAAVAPPEPAAAEPGGKAADRDVLQRGRYLVENVMGCAVCHTPVGPTGPVLGKRYAGGLEIPETFGTWRSPNITQDRKTGIGGWTDEQILAAIREGKRPDGTTLYPIMPYPWYHVLADEDGRAVVAYLRTIAPIENLVAGNDLKMPKPSLPPPRGTLASNRGEYLASLMHCSQCHTPLIPEFAPDTTKLFAGGFEFNLPMLGTGTIYSPNITPDPNTGIGGRYDEAKLVAAVKQLEKADGSPILPPMAFFAGAWKGLTDEDAGVLAAYILSVPPIEHQVPRSTFKPSAAAPGGASPAAR